MAQEAKHIILFDGICNLCNRSVQFVIKHDKKRQFKFASIQSTSGQVLLKEGHFNPQKMDSFVLISEGQYYTQSTGALRVLKILGGAWSFLYLFIFIPAFIRNAVYNLIATNRYRWFGKKDACMIATPELKERFLE